MTASDFSAAAYPLNLFFYGFGTEQSFDSTGRLSFLIASGGRIRSYSWPAVGKTAGSHCRAAMCRAVMIVCFFMLFFFFVQRFSLGILVCVP